MNPVIAQLVSAARKGDRESFSKLVSLHQNAAASISYGILGETHLAADAVQDAYLKSWQGLAKLREDGRFSAWFMQIVRTSSLDLLRHRKRKAPESAPLDEDRDAHRAPGPVESLERRERSIQIRELIDDLPPEYREVLLLKHDQGRSYRDIARLLGMTAKGVESRLFRARQTLAGKLKRLDGDGQENR